MSQNQLDIPIQPVERPILCNPYEEPSGLKCVSFKKEPHLSAVSRG